MDPDRSGGRRARERDPRRRAAALGGGAGGGSAGGPVRVDPSRRCSLHGSERSDEQLVTRSVPGGAARGETDGVRSGSAGARRGVRVVGARVAAAPARRRGPADRAPAGAPCGPGRGRRRRLGAVGPRRRGCPPAEVNRGWCRPRVLAELDRPAASAARSSSGTCLDASRRRRRPERARLRTAVPRAAGLPEPKRQRTPQDAEGRWRYLDVAWISADGRRRRGRGRRPRAHAVETSGRTTCSRRTTSPSTTRRSCSAIPGTPARTRARSGGGPGCAAC